MLKSQLLSIISKIRKGATSPTNISDSLEALATNPPYGGTAITTTLPTVLAQGEQIIYRDPNGVQSLWIGNADGEAWPAVGYKEYVALLTQAGTDAPVATVKFNNTGQTITYSRGDVGVYSASTNTDGGLNGSIITHGEGLSEVDSISERLIIGVVNNNSFPLYTSAEGALIDDILGNTPIIIRIYP